MHVFIVYKCKAHYRFGTIIDLYCQWLLRLISNKTYTKWPNLTPWLKLLPIILFYFLCEKMRHTSYVYFWCQHEIKVTIRIPVILNKEQALPLTWSSVFTNGIEPHQSLMTQPSNLIFLPILSAIYVMANIYTWVILSQTY